MSAMGPNQPLDDRNPIGRMTRHTPDQVIENLSKLDPGSTTEADVHHYLKSGDYETARRVAEEGAGRPRNMDDIHPAMRRIINQELRDRDLSEAAQIRQGQRFIADSARRGSVGASQGTGGGARGRSDIFRRSDGTYIRPGAPDFEDAVTRFEQETGRTLSGAMLRRHARASGQDFVPQTQADVTARQMGTTPGPAAAPFEMVQSSTPRPRPSLLPPSVATIGGSDTIETSQPRNVPSVAAAMEDAQGIMDAVLGRGISPADIAAITGRPSGVNPSQRRPPMSNPSKASTSG